MCPSHKTSIYWEQRILDVFVFNRSVFLIAPPEWTQHLVDGKIFEWMDGQKERWEVWWMSKETKNYWVIIDTVHVRRVK